MNACDPGMTHKALATWACVALLAMTIPGAHAATEPGTWAPTGPVRIDANDGVVSTREVPGVVYVPTLNGRLFRSIDRGAHWAAVTGPVAPCAFYYIALDGGLLFAFGYGDDPDVCSRSWRSVDGGASWSLVAIDPNTYAFEQRAPGSVIHALSYQAGVTRSHDGGATWAAPTGGWPSPHGLHGIHVVRDATDMVFAYGGFSNLLRSADGGVSWAPADAGLPDSEVANLGITAIAGSKDALVIAIKGEGVYRSVDGGTTWIASNTGLANLRVLHLVDVDATGGGLVAVAVDVDESRDAAIHGPATFYRSPDGGATWVESGRLDTPGLTGVATVDGAPSRLVAATRNGVYVSDDLGANWTPVPSEQGLPAAAVNRVSATPSAWIARWWPRDSIVRVDAGVFQMILPAPGYGYTSSLGDEGWTPARRPDGQPLDLLPPSGWRHGVLYAFDSYRLLRSTDGGTTWATMLETPQGGVPVSHLDTRVDWILDGPSGDPVMFAAGNTMRTYQLSPDNNGATLYETVPYVARSNDGGVTWTRFETGARGPLRAVARSPLDPDVLYASVERSNVHTFNRILRSGDGGRSWSDVGAGIDSSLLATSIVVDPARPGVLYVSVASNGLGEVPGSVFRSLDGGATFTLRSAGLPPVGVNVLVLDRNDPATLYAGTHGAGVYRSIDGGAHWSAVGSGLPAGDASRVLTLALDPVAGRTLFAGTGAGAFLLDLVPDAGHVPVVEYFHAGFGHYFMSTVMLPDLRALDTGAIPGWARTGKTLRAYPADFPARQDVCRFFSGQTFAPRSSHFYTPYASECVLLKAGQDWIFEGDVFRLGLPTGVEGSRTCAPGSSPLYRAYNDGRGGAANHRYTPDPSVLDAMIAQGWIMEGEVESRVFACLPPQP